MKILFLHGWQSVPGSVKPTFLVQHGHEVINPKLPDEDFEGALRIAQAEYDRHRPDVVVGSSRGGAVAMNIVDCKADCRSARRTNNMVGDIDGFLVRLPEGGFGLCKLQRSWRRREAKCCQHDYVCALTYAAQGLHCEQEGRST